MQRLRSVGFGNDGGRNRLTGAGCDLARLRCVLYQAIDGVEAIKGGSLLTASRVRTCLKAFGELGGFHSESFMRINSGEQGGDFICERPYFGGGEFGATVIHLQYGLP